MRIKAEIANKREEAALQAFLDNENLNGRECNDMLHRIYGWRMNLGKIYRLKKKADEARKKTAANEGATE